jgi:2-dehydro-3-deoxyphosphooctonate aldolase (KDO 8-P synthase)
MTTGQRRHSGESRNPVDVLGPGFRRGDVKVAVGHVRLGNGLPLALIAGPCVIEDADSTVRIAKKLDGIARARRIPFVFKASYDKANRSSLKSYRGPGLRRGLDILQRVKEEVGCAVLTDVHCQEDVRDVARVADILQIPAFLSRQTDLLLACAMTGRVVNVKKGQFLAPWDMEHAVRKLESTGNRNILLTERGVTFGYNNLVVDMRSFAVMKQWGYPVVYDATHSVQLPGALNGASGGQREFVVPLARAAVALGVAGLFCEVHPDPEKALSDGPNSLPLGGVTAFLKIMQTLDKAAKSI